MRILDYLRRNALGLMLLAAILVSFTFTLQQSSKDTAQVRVKAIQICTANSIAQALVVAFKEEVAQEWREQGELATAEYFAALARGGLALIPLPADAQHERPNLSRVERDRDHYDLLPGAKALMHRGCVEAYNPN